MEYIISKFEVIPGPADYKVKPTKSSTFAILLKHSWQQLVVYLGNVDFYSCDRYVEHLHYFYSAIYPLIFHNKMSHCQLSS